MGCLYVLVELLQMLGRGLVMLGCGCRWTPPRRNFLYPPLVKFRRYMVLTDEKRKRGGGGVRFPSLWIENKKQIESVS